MTDRGMVQYFLDQLDDPAVTARAMFGGHGIYRDGKMFALVYDEVVFAKVSDAEAKSSERQPFRPRANQTLWSYREIMADEIDDPDALASLVGKAQQAANSSH